MSASMPVRRRCLSRRVRRLFLELLEDRSLLTTIVVTGTGDTIAVDGLVTLREAITAANTNAAAGDAPAGDAGLDTISFNIPGSGVHTISPRSDLPRITQSVSIDGYTQPGASPNTLPEGNNAVLLIELQGNQIIAGQGFGLHFGGAHGSIVRGLVINGDFVSGIELSATTPTTGMTIAGNFIGTDPTGTIRRNNQFGIRLNPGSNGNTIGGTTPAARNVLSGNTFDGIMILSNNNIVQGNFLGTDRTGTVAVPNSSENIHFGTDVASAANNLIGGTTAAARNIIVGAGEGIIFYGPATTGNRVQGNYIGTDVTGTQALGNLTGIRIVSGMGNTIGGAVAGAGNLIAFSAGGGQGFGQGIEIVNNVANVGNVILGNSIFTSAELGIDLRAPGDGLGGVTQNDTGDADTGANNLQNFPVITAVTQDAATTTIQGTLNSVASTSFRIEFFANAAADPSGFGEGQNFIGFTTVTTGVDGNASFNFNGPTQPGTVFTATATRLDEQGAPIETSEFSAAFIVQAACSLVVINTNDSGMGSLRQAIICSNASVGVLDTISFNIPGPGPHTISPLSALPEISDPIIIDGYTQPGASANTNSAESGLGLNAVLRIELDGSSAGLGSGLTIRADDSTVRGLAINRFNDPGGPAIDLIDSSNVTIAGNFLGTNVAGTARLANRSGVRIRRVSSSDEESSGINIIGGITPADRNLISGNDDDGILIFNSEQNLVQGNLIGTNALGTASLVPGPRGSGISIVASPGNMVGGAAAARNVISGHRQFGVGIFGDVLNELPNPDLKSSGNTIVGNLIGTGVGGVGDLGNRTFGVIVDQSGSLTDVFNNRVEGNTIAFNDASGVAVRTGALGNAILGNSIFLNDALGIDLDTLGVTPNDPGDPDTGSNNLQNFPVITSVTQDATTTTIQATLSSVASTSFRIEFFASAAADASGFGEGQNFIGFTNVTTDATGNATFNFDELTQPGTVFTATATRLDAALLPIETSEFSAVQTVNQATTTTILVSSDANSIPGQPVTFTAMVTTQSAGVPTGTVTFRIDGESVSVVPLNGAGQAFFMTSALTIGTHMITADYTSDSPSFTNSSAPPLTQTVSQVPTTTMLTSSDSASDVGQQVTFTATVSAPEGGTPTGTVTFRVDGGGDIVVPLNVAGQASFMTTTLTVGMHTITAEFLSSTSVFVNSSATPLVQTVLAPAADLAVTKDDSPDPFFSSSNLTYSITVTNNGPGDAQNVTLTDVIPANTGFVSFFAPGGWNVSTTGGTQTASVIATRPTLPASSSPQVFTLIVSPGPTATITNTAAVTSISADPNPTNNSDTVVTTVNAAAEVSVAKTVSRDSIGAGENLTYTIVVRNDGLGDAQNVTLTDRIPANTTFVSFSSPAGWTSTTPPSGDAGTITSTIPTLVNGATASFILIVRVDDSVADGTIVANTVNVATTTPDRNPTNNADTETTSVGMPGLPEGEVTTLNSPGAPGTATLEDDADNPDTGALIVTGTSGNDVIIVEPRSGNRSQLRVLHNGRVIGTFNSSAVQHIVAFGLAGNDKILINRAILKPATLFGDAGNDYLFGAKGPDGLDGGSGADSLFGGASDDTLRGGDGNDFVYGQLGNDFAGGDAGNDKVFGEAGNDFLLGDDGNDNLYGGTGNDRMYGQAGNDQLFGEAGSDVGVGGDGNDKLFGSSGRDMLIGGDGLDTLFGEAHDDILVAGPTVHDEDDEALQAILAEWTSAKSHSTRVTNLRTGGGANGAFVLDGATVLDDDLIDTLWGIGGLDWFLFGDRDKLKDKAASELVN